MFMVYPDYMDACIHSAMFGFQNKEDKKDWIPARIHHRLSNNSDCTSKTTGDAKSDGQWQDQRGGRGSALYWRQSRSLSPIIHGIATDTYASSSLTAKLPGILLNCKVRYSMIRYVVYSWYACARKNATIFLYVSKCIKTLKRNVALSCFISHCLSINLT